MNINKYIHNAIFRYSQCHFLEYICINFYTIKNAETQNIRFCKFVRTLKICLNDPICVPTTVLETLFHINENETRNIFNSQTNHYHWFQIRGEDNGCMRTRAQRQWLIVIRDQDGWLEGLPKSVRWGDGVVVTKDVKGALGGQVKGKSN